MRTLADVLAALPRPTGHAPLPAPAYAPAHSGAAVMMAVESMARHTTDEGWQIALALQHAGYRLAGYRLPIATTNAGILMESLHPAFLVVQDQREWDVSPRDFREPRARFTRTNWLKDFPSTFRLTILKDAHQKPDYHAHSAAEMGVHGWVVYYHPRIVAHLAPYVRPEHLVRTYHTVDRGKVPTYSPNDRAGALLSGAVSNVYPWRQRLVRDAHLLPGVTVLRHPGYHRQGCATPAYLDALSRFRVAICTSSIYGYALRKIIEATACGCRVVTDLPVDEVLPEIDGNLIRLPPTIDLETFKQVLRYEYGRYDPEQQRYYAERACSFYDYRPMGERLAADIRSLAASYTHQPQEVHA